jgi:hypothetical protein
LHFPRNLGPNFRLYMRERQNMKTLQLRHSINRSPVGHGFILVLLLLASFVLSQTPNAFGVSPAPDGGYPNGNTAEGTNALLSLTTGSNNTATGTSTLRALTTGSYNTATGFQALFSNTANSNTADGYRALLHNTTGSSNTAAGYLALQNNTTGSDNTANGSQALEHNTTGSWNTASGSGALYYNTTGNDNTANGFEALVFNTTGHRNTATGYSALLLNTTGNDNTATGFEALRNNTTGTNNTANGLKALFSNTTGYDNTASGSGALDHNTIGTADTANGFYTLSNNTTGNHNTASGLQALLDNTTGNFNTAEGSDALASNNTGSNNIGLGYSAGYYLTTGSNNIDIGNVGVADEANKIRLGTVGIQNATFVAGIAGVAVTGSAVLVSSSGQLGVAASSSRFKADIKPMEKASESILALKPVSFRYKPEIDPDGIPQFGLVAEDVEKVNPDLVARDAGGKIYTVRYDAVNAMLLNEFLKEHRKVEEQGATIAQLKKDFLATVTELTGRLKEQDSKIEKVSAHMELSKFATARVHRGRPAPRAVVNNQ